ncbi:hypothetical protein HMPREF9135_0477 [Segatella baroniae F0067]|uniref:Uncharacterized protein n=1 Tax=Segatella baroniae F0067 TaxID=1115809 RepID=U2P945_9BACT|nr:hypothetical protein [Segatella baroniae]ERK40229.1 hypothetical protein HMPREF9135_0477 [Segatella baroniae F0067]
MKIKEFEKAIDALCAGVTIDEMKLKHSNVRQANAHTDSQLIVWDEYGRAFSAGKESEREMFLADGEDGNIIGMSGVTVERDKSFDLKFD